MDWSKLHWENGSLWWVVVAVIVVMVLAQIGLFIWRRRVFERLGDRALAERLVETRSRLRQIVKAVLAVVGIGLVVLTILRPQYGMREGEVTHSGIDIAVLLDASQSMLVRDVAPDRFTASKREIVKVLRGLSGGRVSLIPFYMLPFVQTPLTSDFESVEIYLRDLHLQDIADPEMRGTNIGRALSRAVSVLRREEGKDGDAGDGPKADGAATDPAQADPEVKAYQGSLHKAIVLFSDGEEHEAIPEELIAKAKAAGIRIFAVGVGTRTGFAVPSVQEDGLVTGVLKEDGDEPVFSSVNETFLRELAEATGGAYFSFANRSVAKELIAALEGLDKKEFEARMAKMGEDRFPFILLPALLLLALEAVLSDKRRLRRREELA